MHTLSWGSKAGCLWLRLMVILHRLLFETIVFTHTYLGWWYEKGSLARGVGFVGRGCQQMLENSGRERDGMQSDVPSNWRASQKSGLSFLEVILYLQINIKFIVITVKSKVVWRKKCCCLAFNKKETRSYYPCACICQPVSFRVDHLKAPENFSMASYTFLYSMYIFLTK